MVLQEGLTTLLDKFKLTVLQLNPIKVYWKLVNRKHCTKKCH